MKPASFLQKYETILFDLDGVITSEYNYWTTAAVTVWELLFGSDEEKIEYLSKNREDVKKLVFFNDKTISFLKNNVI